MKKFEKIEIMRKECFRSSDFAFQSMSGWPDFFAEKRPMASKMGQSVAQYIFSISFTVAPRSRTTSEILKGIGQG
jgi:peptide methionine sulfoxide reductase MsrB